MENIIGNITREIQEIQKIENQDQEMDETNISGHGTFTTTICC